MTGMRRESAMRDGSSEGGRGRGVRVELLAR
jgi:hypothetical protein